MLRAGFIGFGRMGITHYSILNTHPSVSVGAVCDASDVMLGVLNKYTGIPIYSDYREMIQEQPLDFVVVSTPSDSHGEIIRYCIDHGLHTFVEKPFALSADEGRETLSRLEGKALANQVGYVNRFNEVFMEVKKLLDSGLLGEIRSFSSEMYGATVLKDSKNGWRGRRKAGGGCMYEFASHCIDLAVYLFGMPENVGGCVTRSVYSSQVEDLVGATLFYGDGCSGSVTVNWSDESYRKPTNIVKVFGTKGRIVADKHAYKVCLRQADRKSGFEKGWNTRYITEFAEPVRFYVRGNEFTRQLDYFVQGIEEKRTENVASFAEALRTDMVMEAITENAALPPVTRVAGRGLARSMESVPARVSRSFWIKLFAAMGIRSHA